MDTEFILGDLQARLIASDDAPALAEYYRRNREAHQPWTPIFPEEFFTERFQREKIAQYMQRHDQGQEYRFALVRAEAIIGLINLNAVERGPFQNGRFGFSIDAGYESKGIMTSALRRIIEYAFSELGLHRLEANILPHNQRSRRVLEKCGFAKYGFSPRYLQINGAWEDHENYMLLNEQSL